AAARHRCALPGGASAPARRGWSWSRSAGAGPAASAQRQLGALEHRAGGQRGLVPAGAALVVDRRPAPKPRAGPSSAGRAAEALRPTPLVQGTVALGLGAVAGDELGPGPASLELHGIDAHDATSSPSGGR